MKSYQDLAQRVFDMGLKESPADRFSDAVDITGDMIGYSMARFSVILYGPIIAIMCIACGLFGFTIGKIL